MESRNVAGIFEAPSMAQLAAEVARQSSSSSIDMGYEDITISVPPSPKLAVMTSRSMLRRPSIGLSRSDPTLDHLATMEGEAQLTKSWKEKLRQPSDLLVTEIMQDKARNIAALFAHIKRLTRRLAELDPECAADEESSLERDFVAAVCKVRDEVAGICRYSDRMLKTRLSAKNMAFLHSLREDNPGRDIRCRPRPRNANLV